jgi:predicted DNA-binding transcriptional regulator YafY
MARVVIRTYGNVPNYLRTLPLHASQEKIGQTDEYTDFSYEIRPSIDFVHELMSYTDGLEVLEPIELRQKIRNSLQASLERYSNKIC